MNERTNRIIKTLTCVLLVLFVVFVTCAAFAESATVCTAFALASVFCGFTGGICLTATR